MEADTKTQILAIAERMTMLRGFDAFSYRDIADAVGIKTSSIHYYFPTKTDLAEALAVRYTAFFSSLIDDIIALPHSGFARVRALCDALIAVSGKDQNFCLCGMLAADIYALSPACKHRISAFFALFEAKLEALLSAGLADGSIHGTVRPKSGAVEIAACMEGALLIARVREGTPYLRDCFDSVLARLRA